MNKAQYHNQLFFRTGQYFLLPNEIFSLGLSAGEIAVYAYLMRCENRKTHRCWPSFNTIGKAVGKSRASVMKYVHTLEDKELIKTMPTSVLSRDGKSRNGTLLYQILPISFAMWRQYQEQLQLTPAYGTIKEQIAQQHAAQDKIRKKTAARL